MKGMMVMMESQGKELKAFKEEMKANREELKASKAEVKANKDKAEKTQHLLLKALDDLKQQPHAPVSEVTTSTPTVAASEVAASAVAASAVAASLSSCSIRNSSIVFSSAQQTRRGTQRKKKSQGGRTKGGNAAHLADGDADGTKNKPSSARDVSSYVYDVSTQNANESSNGGAANNEVLHRLMPTRTATTNICLPTNAHTTVDKNSPIFLHGLNNHLLINK